MALSEYERTTSTTTFKTTSIRRAQPCTERERTDSHTPSCATSRRRPDAFYHHLRRCSLTFSHRHDTTSAREERSRMTMPNANTTSIANERFETPRATIPIPPRTHPRPVNYRASPRIRQQSKRCHCLTMLVQTLTPTRIENNTANSKR